MPAHRTWWSKSTPGRVARTTAAGCEVVPDARTGPGTASTRVLDIESVDPDIGRMLVRHLDHVVLDPVRDHVAAHVGARVVGLGVDRPVVTDLGNLRIRIKNSIRIS